MMNELCGGSIQGDNSQSWKQEVCYDSSNHRVTKGEWYIGKVIRRGKESIVEPNTKTKVGATKKERGRESTEAHNS